MALAVLAPAALGKPGDLIVGDTGPDGKLLRVKPSGAVSTLSNDPDLVYPAGTTFSAAGQLFAADYDTPAEDGDGAILRVNPLTGAATVFEDDLLFEQPIHLDYHPNGFLYVPDFAANTLVKVNPVTGATESVGDFTDPEVDDPISIAVLPTGSMVVGQNVGGAHFQRVQPDGSAAPIEATGVAVGMPYGIAADARGRVLIADQVAGAVLRMVPRTGRVTELARGGILGSPLQPAELPSGKIAVANGDGVVVVNPKTGAKRLLVDDLDGGFAEGISVEPPKCSGRRANIVGTRKRDRLKGSRFPDVIAGLGGDDVIRGLGAKDRLCGNGGDDVIRGGSGRDKIRGGPGRDDQRQ